MQRAMHANTVNGMHVLYERGFYAPRSDQNTMCEFRVHLKLAIANSNETNFPISPSHCHAPSKTPGYFEKQLSVSVRYYGRKSYNDSLSQPCTMHNDVEFCLEHAYLANTICMEGRSHTGQLSIH